MTSAEAGTSGTITVSSEAAPAPAPGTLSRYRYRGPVQSMTLAAEIDGKVVRHDVTFTPGKTIEAPTGHKALAGMIALGALSPIDPEDAAELDRHRAIRDAVGALTGGDFTADGKPKIAAIEAATGFQTSRHEVDAALAGVPGALATLATFGTEEPSA